MSSHVAPVWSHIGVKASEGLMNSGHALLSSCSPVDPVLLGGAMSRLFSAATGMCNKSSYSVIQMSCTNGYFCRHMKSSTREKTSCRMGRKICTCALTRKHTHKGADMLRLTDYRRRDRCLQIHAYVHASHTCVNKLTCGQTQM